MTKRIQLLFLTVLVVLSVNSALAQKKFYVKNDLRKAWLKYENDSYIPAGEHIGGSLNAIHFNINANEYAQDYLQIESLAPFFLFVNGKILKEHQGLLILKLDSLATVLRGPSLTITIYQKKIHDYQLKTLIVTDRVLPRQQAESFLKPSSFFKDFVILSGLILSILFVVIIRLHPKLATDYFSVTRIFSLREGEDTQMYSRFTGSSNILFYIFCSLLLGFYLIIIFRFLPAEYKIAQSFKAEGFWQVLWDWVKLSTLLLVILFAKIVIVISLSHLFGMKGLAGAHFFNWIRLLLITTAVLSVIVFVYYILRGHNPGFYITFLIIIASSFTIWIVIAFLKFNSRIEHSMFHLFSYICATEIIPLLITFKVLFH